MNFFFRRAKWETISLLARDHASMINYSGSLSRFSRCEITINKEKNACSSEKCPSGMSRTRAFGKSTPARGRDKDGGLPVAIFPGRSQFHDSPASPSLFIISASHPSLSLTPSLKPSVVFFFLRLRALRCDSKWHVIFGEFGHFLSSTNLSSYYLFSLLFFS